MAVGAVIHAPHNYGDDRNRHAHVMTTTREVGPEGLEAKTRQLDVRSTASVEVEEIWERWAERVDHRSYERQGLDIEPTVKMGYASAAIEARAERDQIAAGEELHAVNSRGQVNEAIMEKRRLAYYIEYGQERIRERTGLTRERAELLVQSISSFVQGTARAMRVGCRPAQAKGSMSCRRSTSHPDAGRQVLS